MFEARLKEAHILRKILEAYNDVRISEVNLHVSPLGIQIKALEASNIALLSLTLECHGFEEYRCDRERNLGINVPNVLAILRMTHADS